MTILGRKKVAEGAPAPVERPQSRFHMVLAHAGEAQYHFEQMANIFSTLTHDAEKGVGFAEKFRRDLTQALEDAGVSVEQDAAAVQEAIADFVPKHLKAAE